MKKILIAVFSFFYLISLYSIDEKIVTKIFEGFGKGVVLIEQVIYLDSKNIKDVGNFRKAEKHAKSDVLDKYIALSSGSGFFITQDGYLITNHHVIDNTDINMYKNNALSNLRYKYITEIPSDILSLKDKEELYKDFGTLFEKNKVEYRVIVKNKNSYKFEIIKSDKDLDFALLKIDGKNFSALPLDENKTIKVGNEVVAIGYPLSFVLSTFLKDLKATITTGNISSIRTDNWSIQHTASINPGNSGGPLLNLRGEVIGINVGGVTNSNNMCFSLSTNKLIKWLKDIKQDDILNKNKNDSKITGLIYEKNKNGLIECGKTIFIDIQKKYSVFLDGNYAANTPFLLKSLNTGVHTIRLESNDEYSEEKFFIKADENDTLNYFPVFQKYKGNLIINSIPPKALVFIDNEEMGFTPLSLNEVDPGEKNIEIKLDGHIPFEDKIMINKGRNEKSYTLLKGYKIKFKNFIPSDTEIEVKSKNFNKKYNLNEELLLNQGTYEVELSSKSFITKKINVLIENKDFETDFMPDYIKSKVVLKKYKKESKVFLNNTEITNTIINGRTEFPIGENNLKITCTNYETIEMKIKIEKDIENTILLNYIQKKK